MGKEKNVEEQQGESEGHLCRNARTSTVRIVTQQRLRSDLSMAANQLQESLLGSVLLEGGKAISRGDSSDVYLSRNPMFQP